MKVNKFLVAGIATVLLSVGIGVGVFAESGDGGWSPFGRVGDVVEVKKGETVESSLYAFAGKKIIVEGDIKGSLYCAAAEEVVISGKILGDVNCASDKVTFSGQASDVRLAGSKVTVSGKVAGDVTAFAETTTIEQNAAIQGDLNGGATNLFMNGVVAKNLRYGVDSMQINGTVNGLADISAQQLIFGSNGAIKGDMFYGSPKELTIDKRTVAGNVVYNEIESNKDKGVNLVLTIIIAVSMLLFALTVILVAPRFVQRSYEYSKKNMPVTILMGFIGLFITPVAVVILAMSYIGLPLAITLLFAWFVLMMMSGSFFAYMVGSWLLKSSNNTILRMLVGSIAVLFLYVIPIINIVTMFAAGVIGAGMVLRGMTNGYKKPQYMLGEVRSNAKTTPKAKKDIPTKKK